MTITDQEKADVRAEAFREAAETARAMGRANCTLGKIWRKLDAMAEGKKMTHKTETIRRLERRISELIARLDSDQAGHEDLRDALRKIAMTPVVSECQKIAREALDRATPSAQE